MVTIECPWCDEPVRFDSHADSLLCEGCRIEVQLAPDPVPAEGALAA